MYDEEDDKKLPAVPDNEHGSDGFDEPGDQSDRTIVGLMWKFVDGIWTIGGLPPDPKQRIVAVSTDVIIQRWHEQRVIETITSKPLPDVDELNAAVPKNTWEFDFNGEPKPPYQVAYLIYFLAIDSCERSTYINSTFGAKIAVGQLKDKVFWARKMRGIAVVPLIEFTKAPMPTRFGIKQRPEFRVTGWVDLAGGGTVLPPSSGPKQLPPAAPPPVKEPTLAEELNDEIPTFESEQPPFDLEADAATPNAPRTSAKPGRR